MTGQTHVARPTCTSSAAGAQVRIRWEERAILAADALIAVLSFRPITLEASDDQKKVPETTLRLQELEPVHYCMRRDKHRSRFSVAVPQGYGLPNSRPSRWLQTGQSRNDLRAQSPKAGPAAQSNRLQSVPRSSGASEPWRDILTPCGTTRPDASFSRPNMGCTRIGKDQSAGIRAIAQFAKVVRVSFGVILCRKPSAPATFLRQEWSASRREFTHLVYRN